MIGGFREISVVPTPMGSGDRQARPEGPSDVGVLAEFGGTEREACVGGRGDVRV